MAESDLSLAFAEIARAVGHYLGWGRDNSLWDAIQTQDFNDILRRGLRLFYYPPSGDEKPYYEWSFLRKTGTITLQTGDFDYDLPDDFGGTILDKSFSFPASSGKRTLMKVPESEIRNLRAADFSSGSPKYYAVRNKLYDISSGQRWEALFYPEPSSVENNTALTYRYVHVPDQLAVYPAGGAQYSEVVLAAVLAAAEYQNDDDPNGPYMNRFREMMSVAIRNDTNQKQNDRGGEV
jgi:hypothetical protein